jgi:hypothetical protein
VKAIRDRNLEKRKAEITDRLANDCHEGRPAPMFSASRPHYEVSQRIRATGVGGIGAIHQMVRRVKLDRRIDEAVVVLKRHLPYHESDHVLNIAYWLFRRRRPPGPKEDAHPFRAKTPTGFEGLRPRSERSDAGMWWLVSSSGLWSASYRVGPGLVA